MRCRRLPPIVAWFRTCGLAEFSSASEMTGNCSVTPGWAATSAMLGGGADPEPLGARFYAVAEQAGEADEAVGPAHVLLQELHHVGAAGDVLDGSVVAAGLGTNGEPRGKIARAFEREGVHDLILPAPDRFARRVLDRGHDVVIGPAAADVAAHPVADLLGRAGVTLLDARHAGHDLSRRAIPALEGVALDEGGLQGMELVALGEALRWW